MSTLIALVISLAIFIGLPLLAGRMCRMNRFDED
jgi:ACR3 family arsenite efflux pump ArsB